MDASVDPHFNLIDEPWIPVSMTDGSFDEASLRTLFRAASRIRSIGGDIPQQEPVILRLCLAIVYRAYALACVSDMTHEEMLEEWRANWEARAFDADVIDGYLDDVHDSFDLMGERPFMQVDSLRYDSNAKQYDAVSELIADVPKEEKFLFSMRAKNAPTTIGFAEAARWLLFCQAYDVAGIKTPVVGNSRVKGGKVYSPKGIPSTGWLGQLGLVHIEGRTLFETLMLNWVMFDDVSGRGPYFGIKDDLPSWERSSDMADMAECEPSGPVGLFTVASRRMRLVPNDTGTSVAGIVSCYGDVVRPLAATPFETMTAWYESTKKQKELGLSRAPLMPKVHDRAKALWRGLGPLLAPHQNPNGADVRPSVVHWWERLQEEGIEGLPKLLSIHAQGIEYGTQSSVITSAYDDNLDVSSALLRDDAATMAYVVETVGRIEKGVGHLVRLARDIEIAAGKDSVISDRFDSDVRERAYIDLDDLARQMLRSFTEDRSPSRYCEDWCERAQRILLVLGRRYVEARHEGMFDRRNGRSIAEAERIYKAQLRKTLGRTGESS